MSYLCLLLCLLENLLARHRNAGLLGRCSLGGSLLDRLLLCRLLVDLLVRLFGCFRALVCGHCVKEERVLGEGDGGGKEVGVGWLGTSES